MSYPLLFEPLPKERIWGGRSLETLYRRDLPTSGRYGESWEITDRAEGVSVVRNGPWAGRGLDWVIREHGSEVLGRLSAPGGRFPWLMKILDARENLSLQVHPPASKATELGGEPKTEMWYVARADPGACLYAGLKGGVTREDFARGIANGTVASCFHEIRVQAGDALFVPSGRVHALGAGLVIFEVQQNSDTTYRVFDWNRLGADGKPRALHVEQSMACIDFSDFEPCLINPVYETRSGLEVRSLVRDPLFSISYARTIGASRPLDRVVGGASVLALLAGRMELEAGGQRVGLEAGDFCLLPSACKEAIWHSAASADFLLVETPFP